MIKRMLGVKHDEKKKKNLSNWFVFFVQCLVLMALILGQTKVVKP